MENVRSIQDAEPLLAARKLTARARPAIESQAIEAIRQSRVLTEDQVAALELCPTFQTQDYVIFLINDTSGNEPIGILWAYAEKLQDNSGFLLSYGTGNSKSAMKIRACAKLSLDSKMQKASYTFGGELKDEGDEITFKSELTNEQFASQMTEIVHVDGGGRKRLVIASTEENLHGLAEDPGHEGSDFPDDSTGNNDDGEGY